MANSDAGDPGTTALERVVRLLTDDAALRPVLLVVVVILGTFVAAGGLLVARQRNIFAMAALFGLALMTVLAIDHEVRSARRMTRAVWALLSIWLAAGLIGWGALRVGVF